MLGRSHVSVGAAAGVIAAHVQHAPASHWPAYVGVAAISALLPDIDSPQSTVGRHFPRFFQLLTRTHRGPFHSLLAVCIVWLIPWGTEKLIAAHDPRFHVTLLLPTAIAAGWLSHILADSLTTRGVPLLWPLTDYHFRLIGPLAFDTGTLPEALCVAAIWAAIAAWIGGPLLAAHFRPHVTRDASLIAAGVIGLAAAWMIHTLLVVQHRHTARLKARKKRRKHA